MSILVSGEPGERVLALGNEAIARGALEAGIGFFSTYPGAPASEVGDAIAEVIDQLPGLHFEYSMNEKVALEGAIGASWAGVRAMCAMKHMGLNVAADVIHNLVYQDIKGGLVIYNSGDPGATSSTDEQDNRLFSLHTHVPVLEPSTVQEAKDFTVKAFELSEKFSIPVIINTTYALAHLIGDLNLGQRPREFPATGEFSFDPRTGGGTVERHRRLLDKVDAIKEMAETYDLNSVIPGTTKWGIITGGIPYGYVVEAMEILGLSDVPILKLGMVYPMPDRLVSDFVNSLEAVLVVEELEDFIEGEIKKLLYDSETRVPVIGKKLFPRVGPLSSFLVASGIAKHLDLSLPAHVQEGWERSQAMAGRAPARFPTFCPGCPHRAAFYSFREVVGDQEVACGTDIGCYLYGGRPPFNFGNWGGWMGVGIGVAQGMSQKVKNVPIMAAIGDSTFFHTGMPTLLNAVQNNANVLLFLMDNKTVGMTGNQPSPTATATVSGQPLKNVDTVALIRGLGVTFVRKIDPYRPFEMMEAIRQAMEQDGVRVIISERECALVSGRRERMQSRGMQEVYAIEPERCQKCDVCFVKLGCPAILSRGENGSEVYYIDEARCSGCGVCKTICPNSAVLRTLVNPHLEVRV